MGPLQSRRKSFFRIRCSRLSSQDHSSSFEGAILTRVLPTAAGRAFNFEVVFFPDHPRLRQLPSKPPEHFHPLQEEYVSVQEGSLVVEVEGVQHIVQPGDPEFALKRGVNHRLYPISSNTSEDATSRKVTCLLSAEDTPSTFSLDLVFFENWYAYQEQVVVHGARLSLIQVMSVSGFFPCSYVPVLKSIDRR